jgi:glycolate oxidase FAD binding subunit
LITGRAAEHAPTDVAALADLLSQADRARSPLSPRGGGTKWRHDVPGVPAASTLSTTCLTPVIDHCAGDLTATISAGLTLGAANAALARAGQWLALDPPWADRATIGGIIAANDSGPRRHRHGAPRDLIIGVEFVRADGTIAKAGGKVVKNVAGYDLARMLCGSLGSLAVVTSATFKLSPIAAVSRTVVATARDAGACANLGMTIAASPALSPTALEIESPPHRVLVRFETTEHAADAQADATATLCRAAGAETAIVSGNEERGLWAAYDAALWQGTADSLVVKASVLPSDVRDLIEQSAAAGAAGRAALGVLYLRWNGSAPAASAWLDNLRSRIAHRGGTAVVAAASPAFGDRIDPWGPLSPTNRSLMAAVKARFDPHGILNPGRGPGGL